MLKIAGGGAWLMGRRASAALALVWKRRIARQLRSRLSVVEFCRREGVSPKSWYAWRRRLHKDQPRAARSGTRRPSSRLFVPVELPASAPVGVRIELPGGAVVILPADAPVGLLSAAIRAAVRVASSSTVMESSSC